MSTLWEGPKRYATASMSWARRVQFSAASEITTNLPQGAMARKLCSPLDETMFPDDTPLPSYCAIATCAMDTGEDDGFIR
ncbi:hypothetical protein ETB97_003417 [Aspergillus alliaceus]|uniref:Uncharacterized protein n=1 Tax=Petromyces alliaceus TaxID=209559 RepID=A0A8H6AG89_PETAA|nr:hypothetical protein ETB97_003417 [Aspergillus burnettii]